MKKEIKLKWADLHCQCWRRTRYGCFEVVCRRISSKVYLKISTVKSSLNSRKFISNLMTTCAFIEQLSLSHWSFPLLTFNDLDWLAVWRGIDLWLLLPTAMVEVSRWTLELTTASVGSVHLSFAAFSILGLFLHRTWWIPVLQWPFTLHATRFDEMPALLSWGLRRSERWFSALGSVMVVICAVLKWRAFAILHWFLDGEWN